jgi:ClpX C4-type zinc finger
VLGSKMPTARKCSFCGKPESDVRMVAGLGGAAICSSCVALAASILGTQVSPPSNEARIHRELTKLSEEQLLEGLRRRSVGIRQGDDELRNAVSILRSRKVTWARIGEALGMSRQSAWERFSTG